METPQVNSVLSINEANKAGPSNCDPNPLDDAVGKLLQGELKF